MCKKYVVRTYNQVRLIAQPVSGGPEGLVEHYLETEDGTRITMPQNAAFAMEAVAKLTPKAA